MKTIKYFTLTLILFLSATTLFAEADGTKIKETAPNIILDAKELIPQVPQIASFDEVEIESITILMMEVARRFSPVMPMEADFNEAPMEGDDLSPVVPLEAPYSETL
ncbi:MAG: hypothetical protein HQ542_01260 [Bacteroidia bacterium]|nr:hypothetical protein [Bacteroidia bacterium]